MGLAEVSKNLVHGSSMRRYGRRKLALNVTIAAILLGTALSSTLPAQTNVSPSTARPVNRYLFIVETSRAMQPRARGVFDAIKHALDSSLNGEIHQGDLVGIWTFNEMVYQELFSTQIWSQPTQLAFAVRLSMFADPKLYQRRSRFDKVVPEMLKVMAENDNVTIILISTGEGVIEGTRFSEQINSAWKEWHDEQEGVHMPLQTVMRARNGEPTDWFLTPAPRPIDLARLATAPKSSDKKENKSSEVILESGLITNQPASVATEQQVAFSVWDLGKTGLTASATSPQKLSSQPGIGDSAPPAAASATNIDINQPSIRGEASKTTSGVPEPNTSPVSAPASAGGQEIQISTTSISNALPADSGKPVELVFVTNAPVQPAAPVETATRESVQPATPAPAPGTSEKTDLSANHLSLLAHARAADPSREETNDLALATPPRGFLRDNITPLLLMIVAGFGAVYCFGMWLRTNARAKGNAFSLTRTEPDEKVGQEP